MTKMIEDMNEYTLFVPNNDAAKKIQRAVVKK